MSETDVSNTKEATIDFLHSYQYSSLPDYLDKNREEGKILNPDPFPEYFTTSTHHLDELKSWLQYNPDNSIDL